MKHVAVTPVTTSAEATTIAIASTATVYTKSFKLNKSDSFGVAYIASSLGTVSLKIELEQSHQEPTVEGDSDTYYVEGTSVSDIESDLAVETYKIANLSPVTAPYGRFKITGSATNDASTSIKMWLMHQEDF